MADGQNAPDGAPQPAVQGSTESQAPPSENGLTTAPQPPAEKLLPQSAVNSIVAGRVAEVNEKVRLEQERNRELQQELERLRTQSQAPPAPSVNYDDLDPDVAAAIKASQQAVQPVAQTVQQLQQAVQGIQQNFQTQQQLQRAETLLNGRFAQRDAEGLALSDAHKTRMREILQEVAGTPLWNQITVDDIEAKARYDVDFGALTANVAQAQNQAQVQTQAPRPAAPQAPAAIPDPVAPGPPVFDDEGLDPNDPDFDSKFLAKFGDTNLKV